MRLGQGMPATKVRDRPKPNASLLSRGETGSYWGFSVLDGCIIEVGPEPRQPGPRDSHSSYRKILPRWLL